MNTHQFDRMTALGTRIGGIGKDRPKNRIHCADGTELSVIAHSSAYCTPRPVRLEDTPPDGYTHVEVGFPSVRPEPWSDWAEFAEDPEDPTGTVYGYVPVETVRSFITAHGGEK